MNRGTSIRSGRASFPLYAKILLCFLANIALVGTVAVWLLRSHFGLESDWLLTRDARQRLQLLGQHLLRELAQSDRGEWDGVLSRLSLAQGMTFGLFDPAGRQVAGAALDPPDPVQRRLSAGRWAPGAAARPPGAAADGPGEGRFGPEGADRGQSGRGRPEARSGPRPPGRGGVGGFPSEAFSTTSPRRYWLVLRMPPVPDERPRDGPPMTLVGMSSALGQSSLLFDPAPWLWAGAGCLGLSALLWWPLVRGVTRTLSELARATEAVASGKFDTRVGDTRRDELGLLGAAVNRMTVRLEGFVTGQRRFLGDIAHELVSPLARMEVALGILEEKSAQASRSRLGDVREEVREMRTLVNELLSFSQAGLQGSVATPEAVPLALIVQAAIEREGIPPSGVRVDIPADLHVLALPLLLGRAVANVLRNSVRHAGATDRPPPPIEVTATGPTAGTLRLTLADRGPGVPEEALPRLFDPFFRLDASRDRETGGVGLGLAIVKSCVEACGGTVSARNRDGGGLVVAIALDAAVGSLG